jgi:hypothetical protein
MPTIKNIVIAIVVQIICFIWYYLALPGSVLSVNNKTVAPSVKTALEQYIVHMLPIYLVVIFSYVSINHPIHGKINCEKAHQFITQILTLCKNA